MSDYKIINSLIISILLIVGWLFLGVDRYVGDHEVGIHWEIFIKKHPSTQITFSNPAQKGLEIISFDNLDEKKQKDFIKYCHIRYDSNDGKSCYKLILSGRI